MDRLIAFLSLTFVAVLALAIPAEANSIAITYSLSGIATVVAAIDTTLTLDAQASGSIVSGSAALNAAWNPVTYSDLSFLDLTTGLLHGNFNITFQDGDTLSGTVDEDDSAIDASPTQTGPFTQTLTFTGGTGEFAGVAGSVAGNGFVGTTNFTVSGNGIFNTSPVPEPASGALVLGALGVFMLGRRGRRNFRKDHCEQRGRFTR
jgi:hypothetical protein